MAFNTIEEELIIFEIINGIYDTAKLKPRDASWW